MWCGSFQLLEMAVGVDRCALSGSPAVSAPRFFYFRELVQNGLRGLLRHKLRSLLTLLGVFFGVAAVITMQGIGEGAQRTVLRDIAGLGLRNIIIDSVQPQFSRNDQKAERKRRGVVQLQYGLLDRDVAQIESVCADSKLSVAQNVKYDVYHSGRRIDAKVMGVSPDYFDFFEVKLLSGRLLSAMDDEDLHRVCVVTGQLADYARPTVRSMLPQLKIGRNYFDVVGVIQISSHQSQPMVFLPYATTRGLYGLNTLKHEAGSVEFTRQEVGQLVVVTKSEETIPAVAAAIQRTLEVNHQANDFKVTVPLEILQARQRTQRILNLVLITIAGISLVVGGIGIMNIMLAVVTERIPEIGLRRALGATRNDILLQFLAETVTLSTLGGVLGCFFGIITVPIASQFIGWAGVITPSAVIVALVVSWTVGLVFGIAPALRAARLDPVTALRSD
jgi:putative ABC transport system permease protein